MKRLTQMSLRKTKTYQKVQNKQSIRITKEILTMKKLLILILAMSMLLTACTGSVDQPDEPSLDDEGVSEDPKEPFVLRDDLLIVRGDSAESAEKAAAAELRVGIQEKTGKTLEITTDWVKDKTQPELAEYEILVGQTIRDISNPEGIGYEDFCIRVVDGKKLVILGGSPKATQKAVDYFLENYVDENGFTFEEIDMMYDASEELRKQVSGDMKGTLRVNFDEVINPDIIGGGVNFDFSSYVFINLINGGEWSGVRSQHIPYSPNKKTLENLLKDYFELIDESGMQYVRLCVSMTMWEPINDNDDPMTTDFEKGFVFSPKFSERPDAQGDGVGFPALNYAYLEAFYKLLDHFEERGLYVVLGNWDNGSEALGFCPNGENWLASTDKNGNKLGRGNDLNVISLDEYAETFAAIMYHLKVEKGYNCVKGISFYNEPEHLNGGQKTLVSVYNKIAEHLTRLGVREETLIQAYDGPVFWMADDNGNPNRITDMDKLCGDAMDIIGYHCYLATIESGQKQEGTSVNGTVSSYLIPEVKKMIAQADGRPVVVSELGTFAFSKGNEEGDKDYRSRIFAAESAIELFNAGAKGYGLWVYNCYLHNYYTMLSYSKNNRYQLIPDEMNYYPSALIMKYLPGGTDIVASTLDGCEDDAYKHVWATVGVRPDGKSTILLVNDGDEPTQVTLEGTQGKQYRYYYVDPEHTDNIYEEDTVSDKVVMRPNSIVALVEE
jgi:alpha-galactosidase